MLQRRGETYLSRIIVPADLRPLLGRQEITRSLRTGDRREAVRRQALWETHVGTYLSTVRAQGRAMTRDQLDEITRRYLRTTFDEIEARLALDWDPVARDVHYSDLVDKGHATAGALAHGDYTSVLNAARELAPEASEESLRKLCRRLLEVQQEAVRAELRALGGEPLVPVSDLTPAPEAAPEAGPATTPRMSEIAKVYGDERVSGGFWTPKTELQNRTILNLLADLLGDPQIGDVSKEAVRKLGQDIVQLPSNMTKRFPGVPPREVLQRLEGDTATPRLEPRSVNKYRQLTRTLFKWATEHDYIKTNPAAVLRDVKEPPAREGRLDFSDAELVAYFAKLPQTAEPRPYAYWIPRILAYSGMRLGECSQLRKEDFRTTQGIPVFDINREDGKSLKNSSSIRQVPVHPRLVELGLLQFVDSRPTGFLWPEEMRTTDNPQRGDVDKLSKLFGRVLRSAGVTDPKKTGAHSFRHTVSARLKDESVPDYQISDLIGHEDDSMTTGRYGKATNVTRLLSVITLLKLPV